MLPHHCRNRIGHLQKRVINLQSVKTQGNANYSPATNRNYVLSRMSEGNEVHSNPYSRQARLKKPIFTRDTNARHQTIKSSYKRLASQCSHDKKNGIDINYEVIRGLYERNKIPYFPKNFGENKGSLGNYMRKMVLTERDEPATTNKYSSRQFSRDKKIELGFKNNKRIVQSKYQNLFETETQDKISLKSHVPYQREKQNIPNDPNRNSKYQSNEYQPRRFTQNMENRNKKQITTNYLKTSTQCHSIRGTNKTHNQDSMKIPIHGAHNIWILCDGHGQNGHQVAWYVSNLLYELVQEKIQQSNSIQHVQIKAIFQEVKNNLEETGIDITLSGCTCVLVMIVDEENKVFNNANPMKTKNKKILCASLGDSSAMVIFTPSQESMGKKSIQNHRRIYTIEQELQENEESTLKMHRKSEIESYSRKEKNMDRYQTITVHHKPDSVDERKRIQFYGGCVKRHPSKEHLGNSPFRLWGSGTESWGPGLAVARAFGDKMGQNFGLICEPSIKQIALTSGIKYILLGSDGLFDQVPDSQIATLLLLEERNEKQNRCEILNEISRKRWGAYSDDISSILIKFL